MISKISSTFAYKAIIVLANFLLVVLVSKQLGSVGRGEMSLFMTDFVLILLFTGIVAGSAMSYYVPKKDIFTLSFIAYGWSVLVCILGIFVLHWFHPSPYTFWLFGAALLQSFTSVHHMVLVGRNSLLQYNIGTALQPLLNLAYVYFFFECCGQKTLEIFVEGFFYSSLVTYIVSIFQSIHFYSSVGLVELRQTLRDMVRFGSGTYFSTIVQTINYRVSYYVLFWFGLSRAVGEMSNGVALAEATWMISNSLSLVLYAHILNNDNEKEQQLLTFRFSKLCFLLTAASLMLLLGIPSWVYVLVFGKDFTELKQYILILSPGVLLLGVSTVMAHYFSAKGNYFVNNVKSVLGLVTVLACLFIFLPLWGKNGAAISTSISYAVSSGYLFYCFFKTANISFSEMLNWGDLDKIWRK